MKVCSRSTANSSSSTSPPPARTSTANVFSNLRFYGPGFELLSALIYRPWPDLAYLLRHVLSALAGLLTIPALYRIGRHFGSAWIGLLAGAALLLMPRFYGHAFINSKDIPFACLFAWTMALLLDQFLTTSRPWARAILFGIVWGFLLSVRPAGVLLVVAIAIVLLAWRLWVSRLQPAQARWNLPAQLAVALVIAWTVMVALWPFAQQDPLNPIRAIQQAMRFDVAYPVLFEGTRIMSSDLPGRYLPEYLLITTPPFVLLLAAIGLVASVFRQRRDPRSAESLVLFLAQLWLLLPILLYLIQRPNVYDGLRHFLFLLPAVALWYAIGAAIVIRAIRPMLWKATAIVAVIIVTLVPIGSLILLHPYQMTYFNNSVGGLAGAYGRYETDYWITSYREAIEWINQQAAQQPNRTFGVLVAAPRNALMTVRPFNAPNVRMALSLDPPEIPQLPNQFDYYIGTTRYGLDQRFPNSPVVHTIGRDNATFTLIRVRQ